MRAIIANQSGGPEVLEIADVAAPQAGEGELLVDTAAIGVNFIETYQRSGLYPVQYPFTPGAEATGRIAAIGEGVEGFGIGDRIVTAEARGTYAEQFVVAAEAAVRVPDSLAEVLTDDRAAALPLQGLTAHYLGTSSSRPEAGETVLLHAGAGGVGLLLTQLLAARDVRVVATASTEEKRELSRAAGAFEAIPYEGFADRARELTDGDGVSVVYDGVGKDTFDDSLRALKVRGNMVLFGGASGPVPPFDLQRLNAGGALSVTRPSLAYFLRSPEERAWRYGELFGALKAGTLDLRVGATFPLAEAADAHRALEGRATTGKVVLTV
ncbi:quinone oxidoreductase family protein [Leucobacter aridicollis]|uniref:quinone oxidoreductase family protein n=1 Tax=Leucobacter aridicollis TaxID=283878 RepID=UPI002167E3E7|nr:quinone oxidoreductase [Leucobacter aridicollis]MCS3429224.1 NADPH2:quinone reductase [Leucobacter aridicollis]